MIDERIIKRNAHFIEVVYELFDDQRKEIEQQSQLITDGIPAEHKYWREKLTKIEQELKTMRTQNKHIRKRFNTVMERLNKKLKG